MKIIIAIILAFVIADVLIVAYIFLRRFRRKLSAQAIEQIQADWKKIIKQKDYKHAIMDADNLLDRTLGQMGFKGGLGTKLKKSPKLFSNINDIWAAHKVRNNIAHQINYVVDERTYKKTMLGFKQAFKDLKVF